MSPLIDEIEGILFGEEADDPNPNPQKEQFSTGAHPVPVDTEWREFDFGFTARSVSVRSDAEILVSFDKPWNNQRSHIRLRDKDLPFTIGGEAPVAEGRVWVRSESGTANIEILAI